MNIESAAIMSKTSTLVSKAKAAATKVAEPVGDYAAYAFWAMTALVMVGFVVIVFAYDTTALHTIGRIFSIVTVTWMLSIITMAGCTKLLKDA